MLRRSVRLARFVLPFIALAVVAPAAVADRTATDSAVVEYDWAGGDGYAGWDREGSGGGPFRLEQGLGGRPGLWISPAGDAEYGPGWVEWRFSAPGASRIGAAQARFAYRNELLAHHCISLGLRSDARNVVAQTICSPNGHANDATVALSFVDPAAAPSSTEFFFRVLMPECKSGECSKHIPGHDPLRNYARLVAASFTLVDRDAPTVDASGALWEQRGGFVGGDEKLGVSLAAHDDGVGVARTWLDAIGAATPLASAAGACDAAHRMRVVCAADMKLSATVDTSTLAEGRNTFIGHARDAAGHVGSTAELSVFVDRTPPLVTAESALVDHDVMNGSGTFDVHVGAGDDGTAETASGIKRVSLLVDDREVAAAAPTCDAVRCPALYENTFSIDTSTLSEGPHDFVVTARDRAGNVDVNGEGSSWSLVVDRTAPPAPANVRVARFDEATETATVRWDRVDDGGTYHYRYSLGDDEWSEWIPVEVPEFDLDSMPLGEVFDVEVRVTDLAGNTGPTAAAQLTVFAATETPAEWDKAGTEPGSVVELTDEEKQRATDIAQHAPEVTSLLAGQAESVDPASLIPLALDNEEQVGAQLDLELAAPATIEGEWLLTKWNDDETAYEVFAVRAKAEDVTSVRLLVDFRNGRVISLEPNAEATFDEPAGGRRLLTSPALFRVFSSEANDKKGGRNVYRLTRNSVWQLGNDSFWNWDFHHERSDLGTVNARRDTDWPVTLIWTGQADIDEAHGIWNKGKPVLPHGFVLASPQHGYTTDAAPRNHTGTLKGAWSGWSGDKGVYLGNVCHPHIINIPFVGPVPVGLSGHKWHYRTYAPTTTRRLYNMTWGYYVLGTSHQDHHDDGGEGSDKAQKFYTRICWDDWYGGTDDAEHKVADAFRDKGLTVREHAVFLHNVDKRPRYPHRWYDSDGWATIIEVGKPPKPSIVDKPLRPKLASAPAVNGDTVVGSSVTADPGLWDAAEEPSFTYRWLVCDVDGTNCAAHERGEALALVDAQIGKTLRVRVTAKTSGGLARAVSPATGVVRGLAGACGTTGDVPAAGAGAPANDDFRDAAKLTGPGGVAVGSFSNASVQQGGTRREVDYENYEGLEDWGYGSKPTRSVWYCWTAAASGPVTLTTKGSPPPLRGDGQWSGEADPPRITVYTGTRWGVDGADEGGNVSHVASAWQNKWEGEWGTPAYEQWTEVKFDAVAGTQYLFYVSNGTQCCASPDHGTFFLKWGPDTDADGDGVQNDVDNCPTDANPDQADYDRNGRGDQCDPAPVGVRVVNQTRYQIVSYVPRCPYGYPIDGNPCFFGGSLYNEGNWLADPSLVDCAPFSTCTYTVAAHVGPSMQLRAIGTYPAAQGSTLAGQPVDHQGTITGGTLSNGGCSTTTRGDGFCAVTPAPWAVDLRFRDDFDSDGDGVPDPTNDARDQFCQPRDPWQNQNQCHISVSRAYSPLPYGPYTYTVYVTP